MTADKTREAIQPPCHRNAWTKWKVLARLGDARMAACAANCLLKPFWRTLVVMHAPCAWQVTWAKWLYPVQSIQVKPRLRRTGAERSMVIWEMCRFPHRRSNAQLEQAQTWAKSCGARLTLCAWESKRRFFHVHAPFKPSKHAERDVHYMARYFKYFLQTHSDSE